VSLCCRGGACPSRPHGVPGRGGRPEGRPYSPTRAPRYTVPVIDKDNLAQPGTPERELVDEIDFARLPRHVAIIMDGNGRWARQRGSPRVEGHRAGIASVRETVETCARLELDALTLYAFSVENWKRPRFEIVTLMSLLKEYLNRELANLLKNDIRFRVVGRMNELDASVQKELSKGLAGTSSCRGMTFNIALNYGGRTEIVDACRSLANDVVSGRLTPEQIDEETLGSRLGTAGLLIRTSGEMRVSNFLLWQIAYSEIWVTPTLWPDFRKRHLFEAILEFQKRERRYGGVIDEGRAQETVTDRAGTARR
jgi:undecaprenyl diphosphate synthase